MWTLANANSGAYVSDGYLQTFNGAGNAGSQFVCTGAKNPIPAPSKPYKIVGRFVSKAVSGSSAFRLLSSAAAPTSIKTLFSIDAVSSTQQTVSYTAKDTTSATALTKHANLKYLCLTKKDSRICRRKKLKINTNR